MGKEIMNEMMPLFVFYENLYFNFIIFTLQNVVMTEVNITGGGGVYAEVVTHA